MSKYFSLLDYSFVCFFTMNAQGVTAKLDYALKRRRKKTAEKQKKVRCSMLVFKVQCPTCFRSFADSALLHKIVVH